MKKIILTCVIASLLGTAAYAGGGEVIYRNEYTITTYEVATKKATQNKQPYVNRQYAPAKRQRPCPQKTGQPISVKTHSEVIDHYQVYQPVTVYEPAGTYTQRRIIENQPCDRCF